MGEVYITRDFDLKGKKIEKSSNVFLDFSTNFQNFSSRGKFSFHEL